MQIAILAVGRMKSGPETELLERYVKRATGAGRGLGISRIAIRETPESRSPDASARKQEEATALVAGLAPGSLVIALDETGEDATSREFAAILRRALDEGVSELAFMIGGPDGHGAAIGQVARRSLRLGRLTWPHQIVRVLLTEQIYRAVTILSGHPYHRG